MKAVQVPYCYHPDAVGGTEIYVETLARELSARGLDVTIAAPGDATASYPHRGLWVHRFAVSRKPENVVELYGEGDSLSHREFASILDELKPDVVHLHAFTRAVSLRVVREIKQRGIPVAFTYHTPTVSCQRGTLMKWGREPCDGVVRRVRCSQCTLHGLGASRMISTIAGGLPPAVGALIGAAQLSGRVWSGLRMSHLMTQRHAAFRALMAEVDHVVTLCEWARKILLRNGVPAGKISMSRHGLPHAARLNDPPASRPHPEEPVRIAFLGRLDRVKGPDLLVRAVRGLEDGRIRLDLYGVITGPSGEIYRRELENLAAGDRRIGFHDAVPSDHVVPLLAGYDAVAVPSQWLETGPLVVLEAFAAGVPVLGSNLGGIAELVTHGVDGLLVEPGSMTAWRQVLRRFVDDPDLRARLCRGIRPPRGVDLVAEEMLQLYGALTGRDV